LGVAFAIFFVWAWWHMQWFDWSVIVLTLCGCVASVCLWVYEKRQATASTRMPWRVMFKGDIRECIDRTATADRVVVGFAAGKRPVLLDFEADAPHAIAAMGTGGGKSTLLRGLIAQLLHNGVEHITIIDPKLVSLIEFADHPRVRICITYGEMWEGILDFYHVMRDRYQQLHADPTITFPRRVLFVEEGNSFGAEIRLYWNNELGGKGPAPIIQTLALILFQARQAGMNVIGAYQRLSVAAVGTPDARDQFGFVIMSRFKPTAWKSLVGTMPIPRSPRHKGRALVVVGEDQELVQMVGWTPGQARAYADGPEDPDAAFDAAFDAAAPVQGRQAQRPDQGKRTDLASDQLRDAAASPLVIDGVSNVQAMLDLDHVAAPVQGSCIAMQGTSTGDDVTGPDSQTDNTSPPPAMPDGYGVTMKEAIELKLVRCKLGALRAARQRGTFPKPIEQRSGADVYRVRDITEWEANRVKEGASDA
jgi:hypothetical protein